MTDAPHMLFELSMEVLTAPFAILIGRAWGRREHKIIDREHGVVHHKPVVDVDGFTADQRAKAAQLWLQTHGKPLHAAEEQRFKDYFKIKEEDRDD